jgi:thiamine-phosphate pyrophosphorylase
MSIKPEQLTLYAITDRTWLNGATLEEHVKEALEGGATILQLREKTLSDAEFLEQAKRLKPLCQSYNVPLIINDRVDIALEADAEGVHVGQNDMQAGQVRENLGPNKLLGVSCRTVEHALAAQEHGADYIGVGAMFPTQTKTDTEPVSIETLKAICQSVNIPVVAIGGVTLSNVSQLQDTGIAGIVAISAIFSQDDIQEAAHNLKEAVSNLL